MYIVVVGMAVAVAVVTGVAVALGGVVATVVVFDILHCLPHY